MNFQKTYHFSKNLEILYVDDDPLVLDFVKNHLQQFFTKEISIAQNGVEALKIYKEKKFDIVITDMCMPKMGGIEFIKEIQKFNKDQFIVVISAQDESNELIRVIQLGITNFIIKPLVLSDFESIFYKCGKDIFDKKLLKYYYNELESSNKNLIDKMEELTNEILFTQKLSIQSIANMVENCDFETESHVKRIEKYTEEFIKRIPIDKLDIDDDLKLFIPMASTLHDIGKIIIPKKILNKATYLTDDEYAIVKRHSKYGGDLLAHANEVFKERFGKDSYLKIASEIAMYHHEKYDGSGYPDGLKGEDIPIAARIVGIADVYDALRSPRRYKKAWSHKETFDYIVSQSGKSFDPYLVNIFSQNNSRFENIYETIV